MTAQAPLVVVAGLGSEYRRDDGVGPLVAARAIEETGVGRDIGPITDPLDLLGVWDGAGLAVVVDAVRSGAAPGTVHVVDLTDGAGGALVRADPSATTSTHGIGLAGVLRLARAVGHAPDRVVAVGVEGEDFGRGIGLSPAVGAALPVAVRRVVDLISEVRTCA
jgi:hydrogenase maturation protease